MTNGNNNLTILELRSGSCLKEYETMKICFLTGIKEVNFKRNYGASSDRGYCKMIWFYQLS